MLLASPKLSIGSLHAHLPATQQTKQRLTSRETNTQTRIADDKHVQMNVAKRRQKNLIATITSERASATQERARVSDRRGPARARVSDQGTSRERAGSGLGWGSEHVNIELVKRIRQSSFERVIRLYLVVHKNRQQTNNNQQN